MDLLVLNSVQHRGLGSCELERLDALSKRLAIGRVIRRILLGVPANPSEAAMPGNGILGNTGSLLFRRVSPHTYPSSCSVTASGPFRRPAARRRSALATTPQRNNRVAGAPVISPPLRGLGASQNKSVSAAKSAAQTSSGPRRESTPWHLGGGPTRLASPGVTRARSGNSKTETLPCT